MAKQASVTSSLPIARIEALIDDRFPQIHLGGRVYIIEELGERSSRVRMRHHERMLRPGGTVSGPAMFGLADFSVYVAIIAALGEAGIDAVTTNLSINFLTRPEARDMLASVSLIRLGRRLAVGEARLYSDGKGDMVAHAIATYALPPSR